MEPGFQTGAAGWEARMLPLGNLLLTMFKRKREELERGVLKFIFRKIETDKEKAAEREKKLKQKLSVVARHRTRVLSLLRQVLYPCATTAALALVFSCFV